MHAQQFLDLDKSIAEHRYALELKQALERLRQNRDFKQVVDEGYLSKAALRLVHAKGDPRYQSQDLQRVILAQIEAVGYFHQYLQQIESAAAMAEKSLADDEQTREALARQLN